MQKHTDQETKQNDCKRKSKQTKQNSAHDWWDNAMSKVNGKFGV